MSAFTYLIHVSICKMRQFSYSIDDVCKRLCIEAFSFLLSDENHLKMSIFYDFFTTGDVLSGDVILRGIAVGDLCDLMSCSLK